MMEITTSAENFNTEKKKDYIEILENVLSSESEIWLHPEGKKNPSLCILICGEQATMMYFPVNGHPGMNSIGSFDGVADGITTFQVSGSETEIMNRYIISKVKVLQVAESFFAKAEQPKCIDWEEL